MATLRPDGRWQASWKPKNQKRIFFYGQSEKEADALKAAAQRLAENGPTPSTDSDLHTLAGLLWWPRVEHSRPNTLRRYRDAYNLHVRPEFGSVAPKDIRTSHVQRWISAQAKAGLSPATISLHRTILSGILRICVAEGLIASNPASLVKTPRIMKRKRACTPTAVRDLLNAVEGTDLAAPVFLAAVLGMRRGEACGLRWKTCDPTSKRVAIVGQRLVRQGPIKGKSIDEGPTKREGCARSFVLPAELFAALERFGNLDSDYVAAKRNGRPWNPEHLSAAWAQERDRLGFQDWHYHDLRHGAAGVLAFLGVDLLTIAAILGHAHINTTELYAAAQEASATRGFEKVSEALFPVDK